MSGLSKVVAAVARHPVNFINSVREDIRTLNEAPKPAKLELSPEEAALIEEMRVAKARSKK